MAKTHHHPARRPPRWSRPPAAPRSAAECCRPRRSSRPRAAEPDAGQTGPGRAARSCRASDADFRRSVTSEHRQLSALDKYDIDATARAHPRHARRSGWRAIRNVRITLEGHCDERGTREYNLALGDRRANAAKNYLAARGVDAARITTISYGKERPVALGSDEESYAQNRRAVTVTCMN